MRVMVPFDLEADTGVHALREAVRMFADTENVTIYAVHFSATKNKTVDDIIRHEARDFVTDDDEADEAKTIREDQLVVEIRPVEEETQEYIAPAIEEYAQERGIDQIVMSEHERSLLSRVFGKSNTERLVESDVAPVTRVD